YIFRSLPKIGDAPRRRPATLETTCVPPFRLATPLSPVFIVTPIRAVVVSAITVRAQMEKAPTVVVNALDLTEIAQHRGDRRKVVANRCACETETSIASTARRPRGS